jgi:hypothetical protein
VILENRSLRIGLIESANTNTGSSAIEYETVCPPCGTVSIEKQHRFDQKIPWMIKSPILFRTKTELWFNFLDWNSRETSEFQEVTDHHVKHWQELSVFLWSKTEFSFARTAAACTSAATDREGRDGRQREWGRREWLTKKKVCDWRSLYSSKRVFSYLTCRVGSLEFELNLDFHEVVC